jgi:hypothetical protein
MSSIVISIWLIRASEKLVNPPAAGIRVPTRWWRHKRPTQPQAAPRRLPGHPAQKQINIGRVESYRMSRDLGPGGCAVPRTAEETAHGTGQAGWRNKSQTRWIGLGIGWYDAAEASKNAVSCICCMFEWAVKWTCGRHQLAEFRTEYASGRRVVQRMMCSMFMLTAAQDGQRRHDPSSMRQSNPGGRSIIS